MACLCKSWYTKFNVSACPHGRRARLQNNLNPDDRCIRNELADCNILSPAARALIVGPPRAHTLPRSHLALTLQRSRRYTSPHGSVATCAQGAWPHTCHVRVIEDSWLAHLSAATELHVRYGQRSKAVKGLSPKPTTNARTLGLRSSAGRRSCTTHMRLSCHRPPETDFETFLPEDVGFPPRTGGCRHGGAHWTPVPWKCAS